MAKTHCVLVNVCDRVVLSPSAFVIFSSLLPLVSQAPVKKGMSRVDKQLRRFADIKRMTKTGHAVKISVQGNRMPLWFLKLLAYFRLISPIAWSQFKLFILITFLKWLAMWKHRFQYIAFTDPVITELWLFQGKEDRIMQLFLWFGPGSQFCAL